MAKSKTPSLEEKTKNYAKEIKEIKDFVAQVRQTPDMYVGKVSGNVAFITMAREIFQNSIDEILKGNAYSNNIYVTYEESTHKFTVEDNGRGIPHGLINTIFGTGHTSSNYDKQLYDYSAGKNGCGGSMTNALSHIFTVDSFCLGKGKHAEFNEGYMWKKGEVDIPCKDRQGSIISFIPNEDIIGNITCTWLDVYKLISIIVPSTPIGTHVEFTGIDSKGKQHIETIENKDGIMTYLINMTQYPYIQPIIVGNDNGKMKCQIAFTYDTTAENSFEEIISLNNTCPTEDGTHVDGAIDGITKFFRNYMNKIYLNNDKKKKKQLVCSASDIRVGLKLAVVTCHLKALYNGQAKETLSNPDIIPFVSETVQNGLQEWSKTHSNELQKLCKFFKEVIEMRLKSEDAKVKLSTKFQSSSLSGGLPSKYVKPNGNKGIELIIVEGDSALGSARNVRNHATQGIFPIRGKMPNAFTKSIQAMLANEEVASILTIIGAGHGKNFNIDKCKVDKVIIMADADPDGAHIRTLVLRFLAIYCRPLVEAGRVYCALPPLYGIPQGRNGHRYFGTKLEFIKYIQSYFTSNNVITDLKGNSLSKKEITDTLYDFSNYVTDLERVANIYAIDPFLLEDILINLGKNDKVFTSNLKKKYRFLEFSNENNVKIISGVVNDKYHKIYMNDMLINAFNKLLSYIKKSTYKELLLNGEQVSMYRFMIEFNKFMPPKLSRFKGLGEMDPKMLAESTLLPDNRTLVQYSFEDFDKEIKEMRYINSNKDMLLED